MKSTHDIGILTTLKNKQQNFIFVAGAPAFLFASVSSSWGKHTITSLNMKESLTQLLKVQYCLNTGHIISIHITAL